MTSVELEKRLIVIERELARLKSGRRSLPEGKPHPVEALEKIHGVFEDDDAFREATRLGRKWRESQRPKARRKNAKPK